MPCQFIDIICPPKQYENEKCRQELRQDGGKCSSGDPGPEYDDKHQIQDSVEDTRKNEKIKRTFCISDSAQYTAPHIIDKQAQSARKIDFKVNFGLREYIVRCRHKAEHGRDHKNTCKCKENPEQYRDRDRSLHCPVEIFHLFGAEIPADHYASSNGESIKKEYHDVDDHGRGTDCCQSLFTDKVADNDGVHRVVEHLKNIAEKKRY